MPVVQNNKYIGNHNGVSVEVETIGYRQYKLTAKFSDRTIVNRYLKHLSGNMFLEWRKTHDPNKERCYESPPNTIGKYTFYDISEVPTLEGMFSHEEWAIEEANKMLEDSFWEGLINA